MTAQPTLVDLINGCKTNDRKAQQMIYEQFKRPMFAICRQYAYTTMEAEDILQDSFIKVFTHINSYMGDGAFEGWIRRIVVNTALSAFRKNKLIARTLGNAFTGGEPVVDSHDDGGYLVRTINTLPESQRIPFNMHVEGYSHKEIAGATGMSVPQSRVVLCRAKNMLREKLRQAERLVNTKILGAIN